MRLISILVFEEGYTENLAEHHFLVPLHMTDVNETKFSLKCSPGDAT